MRRRTTALMFAVMMLTSVLAVAAGIAAAHYAPWLGTAVKVGQEPVLAPIASIPVVLAGLWLMLEIWRRESRRRYEEQTARGRERA